MRQIADIAAQAVRDHGTDWARVGQAIGEALARLSDAERRALEDDVLVGGADPSPDRDKLSH